MSSMPSESGVAKLRGLLVKNRILSDEIKMLNIRIDADLRRRKDATVENNEIEKGIIEQLANMDCQSNGNAGWQGRIVWMLRQLETQASQVVPSA